MHKNQDEAAEAAEAVAVLSVAARNTVVARIERQLATIGFEEARRSGLLALYEAELDKRAGGH